MNEHVELLSTAEGHARAVAAAVERMLEGKEELAAGLKATGLLELTDQPGVSSGFGLAVRESQALMESSAPLPQTLQVGPSAPGYGQVCRFPALVT